MRRRGALALAALVAALGACDGGGGELVAVGTVERDHVELIAEASEPIVEIAVREGATVEAGAVVLRLDERRMAAEMMRAQGAYNRAVALLAELERGPRGELIEEARAALDGARGNLARDRGELQRARTLYKQELGTKSALDAAQAAFDMSQAQFDRATAELAAMETGATSEELDQARAAVTEASGTLEAARLRQERMTVRAPVDGVVDALPFELGEQPPPGAVVAVLLARHAPYARVYVPEAIRAHVRPGGAARVEVDGVDGSFAARVRTVAGEAAFTPFFALTEEDRGRLTYLAELDLIDESARELPTGLPAEATFDLGASASATDE